MSKNQLFENKDAFVKKGGVLLCIALYKFRSIIGGLLESP